MTCGCQAQKNDFATKQKKNDFVTAANVSKLPSHPCLPTLVALVVPNTLPGLNHSFLKAGFLLSGKNSSWMVIGGALGEMLVPALIAALLGPDDGGWPAALYSICVAISVLLVVVYCASCSQLKAAGGQVGSGQQG